MPQATNEQRALMQKWFGDPIDDYGPMKFLYAHGYNDQAGMWYKPTPSHTVSMFEWECLNFLCDEWDYGYNFRGQSNETAQR